MSDYFSFETVVKFLNTVWNFKTEITGTKFLDLFVNCQSLNLYNSRIWGILSTLIVKHSKAFGMLIYLQLWTCLETHELMDN
jgi:hypothetical protein